MTAPRPRLDFVLRTARRVRLARRAARSAFTLLEVLLALAIIALVASTLIGGASHLLGGTPATPHDVFWKSVQEARKTALRSGREVRLKYDKEKRHFYLLDGLAPTVLAADGFTKEERPLKTFPLVGPGAADLTVEFLNASTKGGTLLLIGGVAVESNPVTHVTFYSDGTCSPFRAQFTRPGAASIQSIDPWTCAPVLTPPDPYAQPAFD